MSKNSVSPYLYEFYTYFTGLLAPHNPIFDVHIFSLPTNL